MINILMYGPPKGHNIKLYLDFFQHNSNTYKLTYVFTGKQRYPLNEFSNITFIDYKKDFFQFLKLVISGFRGFELIWIHNWVKFYIVLINLWFKNKSVKLNFSVWSEPLPRELYKSTIKGFIYRYIFKNSDSVQNLWYGTYNLINRRLEDVNLQVIPWGLSNIYYNHKDECVTQEAANFIKELPRNKVKFFWPKSISYASRHDLIIEAAELLKNDGVSNFVVYFWLGNAINPKIFQDLVQLIKDKEVEEYIEIVEHEFLPFEDIIQIWKAMDVGLQIASHDALSTSLLEPLFFKKEVIVTNIEPYEILKQKFDFEINLINQDKNELKQAMNNLIRGNKTSEIELEKRHNTVSLNFNFEENIKKQIIAATSQSSKN